MTNLALFTALLMIPVFSSASVIPVGITQNQIKGVSRKFSSLMSMNTSNSPRSLGADFKFEISTIYQDLKANNVNDFQEVSSENLLEPMFSIQKGLYLNFDLAFSFAPPVESQLTSGYAFSLSYSDRIGSFDIKPEIYIANYNVNDILNINTSGLSVVVFKKMNFFHLGLGGRVESNTGTYEQKFLGDNTLTSTNLNEASFIASAALLKLFFEHSTYQLSLTYAYSDKDQSEAAVSLGFIL